MKIIVAGNMNLCLQGNYDSYIQTRNELEENQMKRYQREQDQIAHMKVSNKIIRTFHVIWLTKCSHLCF